MKQIKYSIKISIFLILLTISAIQAQELYKLPKDVKTRWTSFENPEGLEGVGAKENKGAKGHPSDQVRAGETVTLLDVEGAGIINRMWMTISDRSPEMLRSLKLEMFWDGEEKPAVSVPFGDFFGVGLGRRVPFENDLFADPEGRSFNCFIPMPFKTSAKVTVTNDSDKTLPLLFYDINLVKVEGHADDVMYFHAFWNRDLNTKPGEDYEILPQLEGRGRFLGTNIGIITDTVYEGTWWGEGEVKMYIDGDGQYPTLVGTGTEDYIGSAWGLDTFDNQYQGALIVDDEKNEYAFYRYHIPDPVYFSSQIRVTVQQIGGAPIEKIIEIQDQGASLIPITIGNRPNLVKLLEQSRTQLNDGKFAGEWTNFYRSDDVSSTGYFYLNRPSSNLPEIAPVELRTKKLTQSK